MCDESTQETQSTQNTTQQQAQASTTVYTPSPQEQEMQDIQLQQYKEISPFQTETQKAAYGFINQLLAGSNALPGFFGAIGQGISPQMTSDIARKSVEDILPSFQKSGILDSGVAASVAGRVAGDVRRQTAEYNIGNKLALLNLALSGSTQIQQPSLAQQGMLNQSLAGLRSVSTTGTGSMTGATTGFGNTVYTPSPLQTGGALAGGLGGLMMGASMWR